MNAIECTQAKTYGQTEHKGSSKYSLVNTGKIIEHLNSRGFVVTKYQEGRCKEEKRGFQPHVVHLTNVMQTSFLENRPEIVVFNSYDTTRGVKVLLGVFRAICANGLIVSEGSVQGFESKHINFNWDGLNNFIDAIPVQFEVLSNTVQRMEARELSLPEANMFAEQAGEMRFPEYKVLKSVQDLTGQQIDAIHDMQMYTIPSLLRARRYDDKGSSLWKVYNRVQENIIRGVRGARKITSILKDKELNQGLWKLAESYL